jgi:hypothetical protein
MDSNGDELSGGRNLSGTEEYSKEQMHAGLKDGSFF